MVKALKHKTGYLGFGVTAPQATLMVIMTPPFKGYRGVTQKYPLPPPILNMVVEAVIFRWVMLVEAIEAGNRRTSPINTGLSRILLC